MNSQTYLHLTILFEVVRRPIAATRQLAVGNFQMAVVPVEPLPNGSAIGNALKNPVNAMIQIVDMSIGVAEKQRMELAHVE